MKYVAYLFILLSMILTPIFCQNRTPVQKESPLEILAALAVEELEKEEQQYKCCWKGCYEQFQEQEDFYIHVYEHAIVREKHQTCLWNTCRKRCANYSALKSHLRVHTKEKPWVCNYCGLRFTRNNRLTYHLEHRVCTR